MKVYVNWVGFDIDIEKIGEVNFYYDSKTHRWKAYVGHGTGDEFEISEKKGEAIIEIAKIRGGNWQRLVPIAEELLSKPNLAEVKVDYYDDFTGGVGFFYKGVWVEVSPGYLRIADRKGLGFKDLLVVRDGRISKLRRRVIKAKVVEVV